MLRIFSGRAGTGKTAAIMNEIKQSVQARSGRSILIVPEQYSHEAERELCSVCGDSLSLYGEVLRSTLPHGSVRSFRVRCCVSLTLSRRRA